MTKARLPASRMRVISAIDHSMSPMSICVTGMRRSVCPSTVSVAHWFHVWRMSRARSPRPARPAWTKAPTRKVGFRNCTSMPRSSQNRSRASASQNGSGCEPPCWSGCSSSVISRWVTKPGGIRSHRSWGRCASGSDENERSGNPNTEPAISMNRAGGPSSPASAGLVRSTQSSGSCRWASTSTIRMGSPLLEDGGLLLIGEGVQLLHVHEAHVVPADATDLVEPVVLAEHLAEARRVAVQHVRIHLLGLEAAQDAAVEVPVQRHPVARLRAVTLPVPERLGEEHDRALRHLDGDATFHLFARLGRPAQLVGAGHDPCRSGRLGPVLEGPHAHTGHRKLRIRNRYVRIVIV